MEQLWQSTDVNKYDAQLINDVTQHKGMLTYPDIGNFYVFGYEQ